MALDLAREPVSLAEAKKHLGVRSDFRDGEIARLVVAARERIELYTGRALVRRTIVDTLTAFTDGGRPASFALGPVHRVKAVRYVATEGGLVDLDPVPLVVGPVGHRWLMCRAAGQSWPSLGPSGVVQVEYVAGFGAVEPGGGDTVGVVVPVPQLLVQAMLMLVGTWFENHEGAVVGTSAVELPFGVKDMCRDFRPSGVA